jgi:predicted Ser/Thr protein kinase
MIAFACPGCNQRLQVSDDLAGKAAKCPRCARVLRVPTPAAPGEAATLPPAGHEADTDATIGQAQRTPSQPVRPANADVPAELADHPRYRVLALLGRGGMGAVYKAEHRRMERLVALKVISPALVDNPDSVRRFHLEVKAAARLNHPNIVTAHDADAAGDLHFLVMEYVEGRSLAEYVKERGPLPAVEACEYARQAALGLEHAHEKGMVHRDIKPHNLMRTTDGRVKILDFGLARFANVPQTAEDPQLTGRGVVMGTADYVAPEQAQDSHKADIRADIYSLGCTLYQLLAGRVPFPGGSLLDKLIQHSTGQPTSLASLRPDLPPALTAVVARMMARDPAARFQAPAEAARALTPFAAATAATAAIPVAVPAHESVRPNEGRTEFVFEPTRAIVASPSAPPAHPGRSRRRLVLGLTGLSAALLLGVGALLAAAVYRLRTAEGGPVFAPEGPDAEGVVSAPRSDPKVLTVAADGTGQYTSLRKALMDARDGMTVRVKPGTYKEEPMVLHASVEVVGSGPAGGVVIETSRGEVPGLHLVAGRVVLRNLIVRAQSERTLLVAKGGARVEGCSFTSLNADRGDWPTVAVESPGPVHLLRSKVHGNPGGCGLALIGDKSRVTLEDCDVADNNYQGVWVGSGAQVTARKCRIHDQKRNGVFVDEHGRITLEDCEIVGNGWNGVECVDDAIAVVRGGAVNRNLDHGLSAGGRASITADGCALRGNAKGAQQTEAGGKIQLVPPR